jgi:hypothetical protein
MIGNQNGHSPFVIPVYHLVICMGLLSDWLCAGAIGVRRLYRSFPLFSLYVMYTAIGDTLGLALYLFSSIHVSWRMFLAFSWTGYFLEFGVAFEIASHLLMASGTLNRIRAARPALIALPVSFMAISCLAGGAAVYHHVTARVGLFFRLELIDGVCRCLMFVGILSLAWIPEIRTLRRTLRLAFYLTCYFGVAFGCQTAHEIQANRMFQFDYFERIEIVRITAWIITMALVAWQSEHFQESILVAEGAVVEVKSSA